MPYAAFSLFVLENSALAQRLKRSIKMEPSQKKYTIESFTELVRQDPDAAYEEIKRLPGEEQSYLMVGMPRDAHAEIKKRVFAENLRTGVRDKVPTP